jgi:hypothetical protein
MTRITKKVAAAAALVLVGAAGAHASGLGGASHRRHDELIGRQHELRRESFVHRRIRGRDAGAPSIVLGGERCSPFKRGDHVPGFRRRDDRDRLTGFELEREHARRPGSRFVHVPAGFFDGVAPVGPRRRRRVERRVRRVDHETKRRQGSDLELVA